MKNLTLTLLTSLALLSSCTKDDLQPSVDPCSSIEAFESTYGEDVTCGIVKRVTMILIDGEQQFTVRVDNPCGIEYIYRYPQYVEIGDKVCETPLY